MASALPNPAFASLQEQLREFCSSACTTPERLALGAALERALTLAQNLTTPPDQQQRQHFRVATVAWVELDKRHRAVTHDLSRSGFSALILGRFEPRQQVRFELQLRGQQGPLTGEATVVSSALEPAGFASRVSFQISALEAPGPERLQLAVLEAAALRLT